MLLSNQILEIFVLRLGMDQESCMEDMLLLNNGSELMLEFILFKHVSIVQKCRFVFPCHFSYGINISFGITLISPSSSLVFDDCFYFIDLFSFKRFCRRSWVVVPTDFIFNISAEKSGMKYIVNVPCFIEL